MAIFLIIQLQAKDTSEAIDRLKATLLEAAAVYTKQEGTAKWLPIQEQSNKRNFAILEEFGSEDVSSL